jgi:hypothetical protein
VADLLNGGVALQAFQDHFELKLGAILLPLTCRAAVTFTLIIVSILTGTGHPTVGETIYTVGPTKKRIHGKRKNAFSLCSHNF